MGNLLCKIIVVSDDTSEEDQINQQIGGRRYIVPYSNGVYKLWNSTMTLLVLFLCWFLPFQYAFLLHEKGLNTIVDNLINAMFLIDVVVKLLSVAYYDGNQTLRVDLTIWYIITLLFDLGACTINYFQFADPVNWIYLIVNMLRFWRLTLLHSHLARLEKEIDFNYFWIRGIKLIAVTFFTLHWGGCMNYVIAHRSSDVKHSWIGSRYSEFEKFSVGDKYVVALYWSITTFTTTGFGDLHAQNPTEMMYCMFYMIVSWALSIYLIGNITNLLVHMTSSTLKLRDTIKAFSDFAQDNDNLTQDVKKQMLSHLSLGFKRKGMHQPKLMMKNIPKTIRARNAFQLYSPFVKRSDLFQNVSDDFLFSIVKKMKMEYFLANEDVIARNESSTDLYILVSGAVDLISPHDNAEVRRSVRIPGFSFGEIGVLYQSPQPYTIRAREISQVLRLSRSSLINGILSHPEQGPSMMANFSLMLREHRELGENFQYDDPRRVAHKVLHGQNTRACDCRACKAIVESSIRRSNTMLFRR